MITVGQHEKLIDRIKGLSEIELDELLKDIAHHLRKNRITHLIDDAFQPEDYEDTIAELERDLEEKEEERAQLEDKLDEIRVLCDEAVDIDEFDNDAFDDLKAIIKKIENTL